MGSLSFYWAKLGAQSPSMRGHRDVLEIHPQLNPVILTHPLTFEEGNGDIYVGFPQGVFPNGYGLSKLKPYSGEKMVRVAINDGALTTREAFNMWSSNDGLILLGDLSAKKFPVFALGQLDLAGAPMAYRTLSLVA